MNAVVTAETKASKKPAVEITDFSGLEANPTERFDYWPEEDGTWEVCGEGVNESTCTAQAASCQ